MKQRFQVTFKYLLFLALGLLFVWLTVKDVTTQQWHAIKDSIAGARHWVLIPVVVMLLLSHYSRALRWKLLMQPLGYYPSTFNTWAAVMIGYLVNSGVPRLGEVVKCTLLAKYEKVRADKLVGTIVVERVVDVVCLLIVFILALIFQGNFIAEYVDTLIRSSFHDNSGHFSLVRSILIASAIIVFVILFFVALKKYNHLSFIKKIHSITFGIIQGLLSIRNLKNKGAFIFHTIFIWLMYLLSTTAGLYALSETEDLGIGAGLTVLAVGSVGMIVTPGGIGAYPLFVAKVISLYGLNASTTGFTLGWLLWSIQTLIVVLGGVIFLGLLSYFNKKKKEDPVS